MGGSWQIGGGTDRTTNYVGGNGDSIFFRWCRGALEVSVSTRNDFGSEFTVFWCDFRFCEPRFIWQVAQTAPSDAEPVH